MKNYYKILELEFGADIASVKKAYRRIALKYHPDKNNERDAVQKFIESTEAYEVLKDPSKKSDYDNFYKENFNVITQETNYNYSNDQTRQQKNQEWTNFGREKAKEYSSIPFEDFARLLLKEISIGANYISNAIAILFAGAGAISMLAMLPMLSRDSGGATLFILLMALGSAYLAYRLFLVAQSDYREERKRKI